VVDPGIRVSRDFLAEMSLKSKEKNSAVAASTAVEAKQTFVRILIISGLRSREDSQNTLLR